MTTEPDALAQFQADPLCQRFEVAPLGRGGSNRSFNQGEFLQLTAADRLEDARVRFFLFLVSSSNIMLTVG